MKKDELKEIEWWKADEIMKEKFKKNQWGNWKFERTDEYFLLIIDKEEPEGVKRHYEIDLGSCNSSAAILDWIGQLNGKNWTSPEDMGYLVEALDDFLDLQGNFCSGKEEQSDGSTDYAEKIVAETLKILEE